MENKEITTIKVSKQTKQRLDKLRDHKRETYEEIVENMLNILNTCKANPEKARAKLMILDKHHRTFDKQKQEIKRVE